MHKLGKIGVIGAGSWATANIKIIQEKNIPVNWYVHEPEIIEHVKKYGNNPVYLSDALLKPDLLNISNDINHIVNSSDTLIFLVPSAFLKSTLEHLTLPIANKLVITGIKGIVPDDNLLVGTYLHNTYNIPYQSLGVITGPCHAEEIALERLSYLTIAFTEEKKAKTLAELYSNHYVRTIISDDIFGTEYAAVLKNIYALACGVCIGLGFGDNFQAVLISNAIREMKQFTDTVHPIDRDIKNSAYLGDLLVTAYSKFSRNRYFGTMIGKGYSVKYTKNEMSMVAEGYYASKCIFEINKKYQVNMPIADAIYNILYKKASPKNTIKALTQKIN